VLYDLAVLDPMDRYRRHTHLFADEVELWTGEQLEHREVAQAGDYIYIPAGVPHVAVNRTQTPAVFMAVRTDPNEQESVVMRADLEAKVP